MAEILNESNFEQEISKGVTLVDFYADWCGPCKMVAPTIDELATEVVDAKVVKVNVDESPMVAANYSIRSIPTFIVFKDGEVVDKLQGANPSKNVYLDLIEKAK